MHWFDPYGLQVVTYTPKSDIEMTRLSHSFDKIGGLGT